MENQSFFFKLKNDLIKRMEEEDFWSWELVSLKFWGTVVNETVFLCWKNLKALNENVRLLFLIFVLKM